VSQTPIHGIFSIQQTFDREDSTRDGGVTYTQTAKRAAWKISSKYALVVRQVFDTRGELSETLVDIKSQGLLDGEEVDPLSGTRR